MSEPAIPLSGLMKAAEAEGWQVIDDLTKPGAAARPASAMPETEKAAAEAMARLLATDDGRTVMEWLLDKTLRRASWAYQLGLDPMQIALQGVMREGQNAIVQMMLDAAARGRDQQPEPPRD